MARIVRLTMSVPLRLDASSLPEGGKPISICTCGLSKKFPYCDGAHKLARQELPGKLYTYSADGTTVLSIADDPEFSPAVIETAAHPLPVPAPVPPPSPAPQGQP